MLFGCGGGGGDSTGIDAGSEEEATEEEGGTTEPVTLAEWAADTAAWNTSLAISNSLATATFEGLGVGVGDGLVAANVSKAGIPSGVTTKCANSEGEAETMTVEKEGLSYSAYCVWYVEGLAADIFYEIVFTDYSIEGGAYTATGKSLGRTRINSGNQLLVFSDSPDSILVKPAYVEPSVASSLMKALNLAEFEYEMNYDGFTGSFTYDSATTTVTGFEIDYLTIGVRDQEGHYYDCFVSPDSLDVADCQWMGREDCSNGIDDDGDTYTDCRDWICFESPECEYLAVECDDDQDNDSDGFKNCRDFDCSFASVQGPSEPIYLCDEDCTDGIDNDGDGAVDYDDYFCMVYGDTPPDCGQTGYWINPQCFNGRIQPGGILCSEFRSPYACKEYQGRQCCAPTMELDCSDGNDDDLDLVADCDDPDCSGDSACIPEICDNGIDDDGDDEIDCFDDDCDADPYCDESQNCDDGVDNDWDSDIDCDDYDCVNDPACIESICDDGIDNDDDGGADCDDLDCQKNGYDPICGEKICGDGIDNEMDKLTDCDDPDCFCDEACAPPPTSETGYCDDGGDNDCDGYFDCDDGDCSEDPACNVDCSLFCRFGECVDDGDCSPETPTCMDPMPNGCKCCDVR